SLVTSPCRRLAGRHPDGVHTMLVRSGRASTEDGDDRHAWFRTRPEPRLRSQRPRGPPDRAPLPQSGARPREEAPASLHEPGGPPDGPAARRQGRGESRPRRGTRAGRPGGVPPPRRRGGRTVEGALRPGRGTLGPVTAVGDAPQPGR